MSTTPFTVTVHSFKGKDGHQLIAYERRPASTSPSSNEEQKSQNNLVFIGGLTSGPHTTNIDFLVNNPGINSLGYSIWELHMRGSYSGFGFSSLKNDAEDIASLVGYLRGIFHRKHEGKVKVVLVGASSGCQGLFSYAALALTDRQSPATNDDQEPQKIQRNMSSPGDNDKEGHAGVDGYILLNPVSDREFASSALPPALLESSISTAKGMLDQGDGEEIISPKLLPPVFHTPVSAYRWWSLAARGGDDDFFSSDLSDEEINRKFEHLKGKPVIFLPGEKDEMVLPGVDREALLERWIRAVTTTTEGSPGAMVRELSGFVPEADHVLSKQRARYWVGGRVAEFLTRLEG